MQPVELLKKYYIEGSDAYKVMLEHAQSVAQKALEIAARHPEYELDLTFIEQAAQLHDVGCFLTYAPEIYCYGTQPYICHGYLGGDLLRAEGYPKHALVCERHTGAGISFKQVIKRELPLPMRDFCPISLEEKLVCFADKFYSKTKLGVEKSIDKIDASMAKNGEGTYRRFKQLQALFA